MLVKDEAKQAQHEQVAAIEASIAQQQAWLDNYSRLARYDIDEFSPFNDERKLGRRMTSGEMERRLKKLEPKFLFVGGPANDTHKKVLFPKPDGTFIEGPVYPVGTMPERSLWRKRGEWVPDPLYKPSSQDVGSTEWEWVPIEGHESHYRPDGYKVAGWGNPEVLAANPDMPFWGRWARRDEKAGRAGWIYLEHAAGEAIRGWRTVLARLVQLKLLTPSQVESEFHADDTPEWKQHLGKGEFTRPW